MQVSIIDKTSVHVTAPEINKEVGDGIMKSARYLGFYADNYTLHKFSGVSITLFFHAGTEERFKPRFLESLNKTANLMFKDKFQIPEVIINERILSAGSDLLLDNEGQVNKTALLRYFETQDTLNQHLPGVKKFINIGLLVDLESSHFAIYDPFSKQNFTSVERPHKDTYVSQINFFYKQHFTENYLLKFFSHALRQSFGIP